MNRTFSVRFIKREEFRIAMALCWRVFCRFEADIYGDEGARSFSNFINDERLYQVHLAGGFPVAAAYDGGVMIGVAAVRSGPHLSLLFVDEAYQRRGVGRALLDYMRDWLVSHDDTGLGGRERMTVNSSPVGVPFYKAYGFTEEGSAVKKDGIYYIPMMLRLLESAEGGEGNDH